MRSNDPPKPVATVQPKVTGIKGKYNHYFMNKLNFLLLAAMAPGLKKPPGPVVSPVKETTQNTSMVSLCNVLLV